MKDNRHYKVCVYKEKTLPACSITLFKKDNDLNDCLAYIHYPTKKIAIKDREQEENMNSLIHELTHLCLKNYNKYEMENVCRSIYRNTDTRFLYEACLEIYEDDIEERLCSYLSHTLLRQQGLKDVGNSLFNNEVDSLLYELKKVLNLVEIEKEYESVVEETKGLLSLYVGD